MIDDLVDDLYEDDLACFETKTSRYLVVAKSFPKRVLDFTLTENNLCIGYLTLLNNRQGGYYIAHDPTGEVSHFNFSGRYGIGIEIAKEYRNRGFGHALLSIAIGFAQKDFKELDEDHIFRVVADGINGKADFYRKFGFEIKDNSSTLNGKIGIYKKLTVPEIRIKEP